MPSKGRWYYLSLGTNIRPEENIRKAVKKLAGLGKSLRVSKVYETAPVGGQPQANYLNAAAAVRSELDPADFFAAVQEIESDLGRVRTADKFAPRTIDIDILMVDEDSLRIEGRNVPHPDILSRNFVTIPLSEIAPELRHPEIGHKIKAIAAGLAGQVPQLLERPDIELL